MMLALAGPVGVAVTSPGAQAQPRGPRPTGLHVDVAMGLSSRALTGRHPGPMAGRQGLGMQRPCSAAHPWRRTRLLLEHIASVRSPRARR